MAVTAGGVTVNVAVEVVPLADAVMTEVAFALTAVVVTVNVPVVDPAATETVAGTVATVVLPDARLTV